MPLPLRRYLDATHDEAKKAKQELDAEDVI
jgi:hypothetical protein